MNKIRKDGRKKEIVCIRVWKNITEGTKTSLSLFQLLHLPRSYSTQLIIHLLSLSLYNVCVCVFAP